jgi:transposase, IS5 family
VTNQTFLAQEGSMLIIAHPRDDRFLARAPFQFKPDPQLIEMDHLLDDPRLVLQVTHDLIQSSPAAAWNGRHSTPAEVTLRSSVVRRLMGWSYATAHQELAGSVQWRWFCRIYDQAVPNHSALRDREALIQPVTLHRLNDRMIRVAKRRGVTQGKQLRTDPTVMATDIHYPTDSRLLSDSVRVLGRIFDRSRQLIQPQRQGDKAAFRNRSRRAKKIAFRIAQRLRAKNGRKKPEKQGESLYRQLVKLVEQMLAQADQVLALLRHHRDKSAKRLVELLRYYLPLVRRVLAQTARRVFEKQTVPTHEKVVSLFEPHTAIIQRGKAPPHETEFGRKIWLSEVDGGLISEYRILHGNPSDSGPWRDSLKNHRRLFGHPPELATGDRGIYSAGNEQAAYRAGVKRVALPQPGAKTPERQRLESQRWFRAAMRFRSGIEGRISVLKRSRRLDRCLNRNEGGLERWVGWAIITNNLVVIAATLHSRRRLSRVKI